MKIGQMKIENYLPALIALLLPTYLIRLEILGVPTTMLELVIYAATIVAILNLKSKILNLKSLNWLMVFSVILLLAGAIIGAVVSPDKRVSLGQLKAYFFDPLLVFWLVQRAKQINATATINLIIGALLIGGLLVAAHAIYQKMTGQITVDGRVIGLFGYSPNYLAMYLAPLAALSAAVIIMAKRRWAQVMATISFLLLATGLALSDSRGGLLAAAVAIFATAWWQLGRSYPKYRWLISITAMALILIGIKVGYEVFRFQPDTLDRAGSSSNLRIMTWQAAWEIGKFNPLWGIGLGNFQSYFTEYTHDWVNYLAFVSPQALHAHNLFLTFWLETGILGLSGFLGIIIYFWKKFFTNYQLLTTYYTAIAAAMLAILIHGLVDTPYFKNDLAIMFWILVGLL